MGNQLKSAPITSKTRIKSPLLTRQKRSISQSTNSNIDYILNLQRSIGNRAVHRMFNQGEIQAKLKIGRPNDIYEQEADRIAEQVVNMPEPSLYRKKTDTAYGQIQRVCPECEDELQRQEEEDEELQPKPLANEITPFFQRQAEPEEEEEIQTKHLLERNASLDQVPHIQRACPECERDLQRQKEEEEEELQPKPLADQITPLAQRQAEPEEEEEIQPKAYSESNALQDQGPHIQRTCSECGDNLQRQEEDEEEELQPKSLADQITPLVQKQSEPEEEEEIQPKAYSERSALQDQGPHIQRACSECDDNLQRQEEDEEEELQPKSLVDQITPLVQKQPKPEEAESLQTENVSNNSSDSTPTVERHIDSIRNGGHPMPASEREYFESRIGYDFSRVRLHTGSQAAESAKKINAKAFTIGTDIVFGSGQYRPQTQDGKRLLAHELTHVVQQNSKSNTRQSKSVDVVQTWGWGSGTVAGEPNFRPVVRSHRPRVRAAMRILRQIVRSRRCRNYFRDHCPGGTAATLRNLYRRMRVWGLHERGSLGGNSGDNVSYEEPYIYRVGRFSIAATLLHELMHMCGIGTTAANERTCEAAVERCRAYTPFVEYVRPRRARAGSIVRIVGYGFGLSQGSADRVMFNRINAGRAISWGYSHGVGSEIRIRVPARARSGWIVVINNNVRSNRYRFRVRR
jgi:hypothetical protein